MGRTAGRGKAADVLYLERSHYGPVLWVLTLGLLILYLVVLAGALATRRFAIAGFMGAVSIFLLALLANFWRLSFLVTTEEVVFGFGLFKKRFRLSEIRGCEPYTLTFENYLGYGIRMGRDRTIAYNTRNGPGIKLDVEGRKRPYVVSLKDPSGVCRVLEEITGGA